MVDAQTCSPGESGCLQRRLSAPGSSTHLASVGTLFPDFPGGCLLGKKVSCVSSAGREDSAHAPSGPSPRAPPSRWTLGSGWRQWSPSGTLSATHFPATVQPDSVVNCTKPLHPGLQNIFIIQNFKCHCVWMESLSFLTQTLY